MFSKTLVIRRVGGLEVTVGAFLRLPLTCTRLYGERGVGGGHGPGAWWMGCSSDRGNTRDRTHVMYHNYVDQLTNVLKSALNGDVKNDEDKDLLEFIQKSELEKNRLHNALFGDADKK